MNAGRALRKVRSEVFIAEHADRDVTWRAGRAPMPRAA